MYARRVSTQFLSNPFIHLRTETFEANRGLDKDRSDPVREITLSENGLVGLMQLALEHLAQLSTKTNSVISIRRSTASL
jgi:hypothetical protein